MTVSCLARNSICYCIDKDNLFKEGKAFGGDGGSSFDDAHEYGLITTGVDRHRCVRVELHWDRGADNKLTSIYFDYAKANGKQTQVGKHRGRDRGTVESLDLNQDTFVLNPNDTIEKITVYVGRRQRFHWDIRTIPLITGIRFYTAQGDVSDLFGSKNDAEETTESFPGYTFAYAKGRAGLWIDRLQFVWMKTQPNREISEGIAYF